MTQNNARYLIGVDGGGTGCRAAVADPSGRMIGQGAAGPANATTDLAQAIANVAAAVMAAVKDAGLAPAVLHDAVAHIGLAGVLGPETGTEITTALSLQIALPPQGAIVSDDCVTSLAGALGPRDGVLLAIGTGALLAVRRAGDIRRIGGWGLNLSDQGSGAWLGRALLEHALLVVDGLAEGSDLTATVLAEFGNDPARIVDFATRARPAEYAGYAMGIVAAEAAGDAVARLLMQRGADHLTRALGVLGLGGGDVLCLGGGLGPHYAAFLPQEARDRHVPLAGTALDGALALARDRRDQAAEKRPFR